MLNERGVTSSSVHNNQKTIQRLPHGQRYTQNMASFIGAVRMFFTSLANFLYIDPFMYLTIQPCSSYKPLAMLYSFFCFFLNEHVFRFLQLSYNVISHYILLT